MYPAGPSSYIDLFKFYFTIHRCEFWGATSIVSPYDQEVDADIWNYPSYDAWLNGEHISICKECQYSPMKRNKVTLSLKKGENLFFIRTQNACTRDTRNIVALSFPKNPDIRVTYPGKENPTLDARRDMLDWIYSISWDGRRLVAPNEAPAGVTFKVNGNAESGTEFEISADNTVAKICAEVNGYQLERLIEITERIVPAKKLIYDSPEEARAAYLKSLSDRTVDPNRVTNCQQFFTTYARLCHGYSLDENDIAVLRSCLDESNLHCIQRRKLFH